ncbi:hypothetical protein [Enterobacter sp. BIGb0383]|uniref:hypothetical protein n=2 Tax=unclassified Enterobacter TaxID=2608935 RepID=UPI00160EBA37|nr:hypothetical protein [Enterobacter sp. BIGb0383]
MILIYVLYAANYQAGKYQMPFPIANTICKFVTRFSFVAKKNVIQAQSSSPEVHYLLKGIKKIKGYRYRATGSKGLACVHAQKLNI